ncbi:MAG: triose-phosphate isomerase, partial [Candidatus Falkowbacteria bacterium]|nr:triose-phosphate isomerase [Candidatus Falkowbacteria bacterium]
IEPTEAEHMHGIIKSKLKEMFGSVIAHDHFRIIYGGSINKTNALKFKNLKNVDGLLVGGASTNRVDFNKIIKDYLC